VLKLLSTTSANSDLPRIISAPSYPIPSFPTPFYPTHLAPSLLPYLPLSNSTPCLTSVIRTDPLTHSLALHRTIQSPILLVIWYLAVSVHLCLGFFVYGLLLAWWQGFALGAFVAHSSPVPAGEVEVVKQFFNPTVAWIHDPSVKCDSAGNFITTPLRQPTAFRFSPRMILLTDYCTLAGKVNPWMCMSNLKHQQALDSESNKQEAESAKNTDQGEGMYTNDVDVFISVQCRDTGKIIWIASVTW